MKLQIVRFKKHEDLEWTFTPGVTLVQGAGGAGKSSVLESLAFVLYNTSDRPQCLYTKKGCDVRLIIPKETIRSEHDLSIQRTTRPNILTVRLGEFEYLDEAAQGLIDKLLGPKEIFELGGYMRQQDPPHILQHGTMVERIAVLDKIVFRDDVSPGEFVKKVKKTLKSLEDPYKIALAQYEARLGDLKAQLMTKPVVKTPENLQDLHKEAERVLEEFYRSEAAYKEVLTRFEETKKCFDELSRIRSLSADKVKNLEESLPRLPTPNEITDIETILRTQEDDLEKLKEPLLQLKNLEGQELSLRKEVGDREGDLTRTQSLLEGTKKFLVESSSPSDEEITLIEESLRSLDEELRNLYGPEAELKELLRRSESSKESLSEAKRLKESLEESLTKVKESLESTRETEKTLEEKTQRLEDVVNLLERHRLFALSLDWKRRHTEASEKVRVLRQKVIDSKWFTLETIDGPPFTPQVAQNWRMGAREYAEGLKKAQKLDIPYRLVDEVRKNASLLYNESKHSQYLATQLELEEVPTNAEILKEIHLFEHQILQFETQLECPECSTKLSLGDDGKLVKSTSGEVKTPQTKEECELKIKELRELQERRLEIERKFRSLKEYEKEPSAPHKGSLSSQGKAIINKWILRHDFESLLRQAKEINIVAEGPSPETVEALLELQNQRRLLGAIEANAPEVREEPEGNEKILEKEKISFEIQIKKLKVALSQKEALDKELKRFELERDLCSRKIQELDLVVSQSAPKILELQERTIKLPQLEKERVEIQKALFEKRKKQTETAEALSRQRALEEKIEELEKVLRGSREELDKIATSIDLLRRSTSNYEKLVGKLQETKGVLSDTKKLELEAKEARRILQTARAELNRHEEDSKKLSESLESLTSRLEIIGDVKPRIESQKVLVAQFRQSLEDEKYQVEMSKKREVLVLEKEKLTEDRADILSLREIYRVCVATQYRALQETVGRINYVLKECEEHVFPFPPISVRLRLEKTTKRSGGIEKTRHLVNLETTRRGAFFDHKKDLSFSERKRVALLLTIALNTIHYSPIVLLDELMTNMKAEEREMCVATIRRFLLKGTQRIVLCAEHMASETDYDGAINVE